MLKTIDRLIQFVQYTGLSARQFDLSIGVSNGYTLRMQKNNASIGSDVLEKILEVYPQLDVVWLLTGQGEMIKKQKVDFSIGIDKVFKEKQDEIESLIELKIQEYQRREFNGLLKEINEAVIKTLKKET